MINERSGQIPPLKWQILGFCALHKSPGEHPQGRAKVPMGPLAAFAIAAVVVSLTLVVVSLICLAPTVRADRLRRIGKRKAGVADAADTGDSGGYLWSQLGGHHSAHDHGHSDGGGFSGAMAEAAVIAVAMVGAAVAINAICFANRSAA
jgi:hypothetical protein